MGATKGFIGPSAKEKSVVELVEKIKENKTLMVVSIKGLPFKTISRIKRK